MVKKRGDTLIEVSLAIGIFSLVAIAVVAVVSGSTSAAQSALEVTITREEIDAQAEALRFIHTSYIAGGSSNLAGNDKYARLWNNIVEDAIDLTILSDDDKQEVLNYNPSECGSIYNSDKEGNNYLNRHGAFVVNTRSLGLDYDKSNKIFVDASGNEVSLGNIIVRPSIDEGVGLFRQAATYPRIIYGNVDSGSLLDDADGSAFINAVEGIFVIAVKDADSTTVVGSGKQAAYYDFYIRTCWFEPGAERPSTISTVIRLQDPSVIRY